MLVSSTAASVLSVWHMHACYVAEVSHNTTLSLKLSPSYGFVPT